jgi:hypothetical protein
VWIVAVLALVGAAGGAVYAAGLPGGGGGETVDPAYGRIPAYDPTDLTAYLTARQRLSASPTPAGDDPNRQSARRVNSAVAEFVSPDRADEVSECRPMDVPPEGPDRSALDQYESVVSDGVATEYGCTLGGEVVFVAEHHGNLQARETTIAYQKAVEAAGGDASLSADGKVHMLTHTVEPDGLQVRHYYSSESANTVDVVKYSG